MIDPTTLSAGLTAAGGLVDSIFGGGGPSDYTLRRRALEELAKGSISGDLEKLYATLKENPELASAIQAGMPGLRSAAQGVEGAQEQAERARTEAGIGQQLRGAQEAGRAYQRRTGARTAGQALALGRMGELQAGTGAMQAGLQRLADRARGQREAQATAANLAAGDINRQLAVKNAQASALQQRWNEATARANVQRGGQRAPQRFTGAGAGSLVGGLMNLLPGGGGQGFNQPDFGLDDPRRDPNTGWVD